ncbi:MAG: sodium:proton antiporter [Alphaproteobacteria bacterium]|nr:sodium:proton antiporter [Alphaproteobacteria bacterium]
MRCIVFACQGILLIDPGSASTLVPHSDVCVPPFSMIFPFCGVLLSISLLPLLLPKFWHNWENYLLFGWSLFSIAMFYSFAGFDCAVASFLGVFFHEYMPFIVLLVTLYTISCGLHLRLQTKITPTKNVLFLVIGSLMSSFIGTTGAAMLLLRPFILLNRHRVYQVHNIIFFTFVIANVGGCLTPLGDPPLFLGYLNGIDFFWPLKYLFIPCLIICGPLLGFYWCLDWFLMRKERSRTNQSQSEQTQNHTRSGSAIALDGGINLVLLFCVIACLVGTGFIPESPALQLFGLPITLNQLIRDGGLLTLALISYKITPEKIHTQQNFSWTPMTEVARVFAAIFITMLPINLMLQAGQNGPLAAVLELTNSPHEAFVYFWLTGIFSSFLDNAPTYLLFFKMAGGDAADLMNNHHQTLVAISMGSVLMGAMTYIGNAPNFMIRSIAKQNNIKMPTFLGYMGWSCSILLPLFLGASLWLFW